MWLDITRVNKDSRLLHKNRFKLLRNLDLSHIQIRSNYVSSPHNTNGLFQALKYLFII